MKEAAVRAMWEEADDSIPVVESCRKMPQISQLDFGLGWNPEKFAREQLRRLVRQVFFSRGLIEVRQVVLSGIDRHTDAHRICTRVGEVLAEETDSDVAVVGATPSGAVQRGSLYPRTENRTDGHMPADQPIGGGLRNLWFLPAKQVRGEEPKRSMKTYLGDIRGEFQYSVVQAPPITICDEALSLAELADGLILVLSAKRSRRAAAYRIRELLAFAQVRLVGTVLSDREFPIPERIYRRL